MVMNQQRLVMQADSSAVDRRRQQCRSASLSPVFLCGVRVQVVGEKGWCEMRVHFNACIHSCIVSPTLCSLSLSLAHCLSCCRGLHSCTLTHTITLSYQSSSSGFIIKRVREERVERRGERAGKWAKREKRAQVEERIPRPQPDSHTHSLAQPPSTAFTRSTHTHSRALTNAQKLKVNQVNHLKPSLLSFFAPQTHTQRQECKEGTAVIRTSDCVYVCVPFALHSTHS